MTELITPVQRAANIRLGLALGAFVLLVIAGLMALFARAGLPKSPEIWKEMQQERSAQHAAAPATAPVAATGEEQR